MYLFTAKMFLPWIVRIYVDNVMLGSSWFNQTGTWDVFGIKENFSESIYEFKRMDIKLFRIYGIVTRLGTHHEQCSQSVWNKLKPSRWHFIHIGGNNFNVQQSIVVTKHEILRVDDGIICPLGLVTPVTFYGRLFIQELRKEDVKWDKPLLETLSQIWRSIAQKLKSFLILYWQFPISLAV